MKRAAACLAAALCGLFALAAPPAALAAEAEAEAASTAPDPWRTLERVRAALIAAGPTAAEFVQTYVPAGFSTGEEERGRLALALPDCLRWDYAEPYPKSFLLCGNEAFYWNEEDGTGRRYAIEREKEPGLDLLLLGVEELRGRYDATAEAADGTIAVTLTPREELVELAGARLVVDAESLRLVEVAYTDREGGRSRFVLSGHGPLGEDGLFSPPEGIDWQEG
jgi:outer membrane lipoprotein-sorting protein